MLSVISGSDSLLLSKKTKEHLQTQVGDDVAVSYIDNPGIDSINELLFAQDLFGGTTAYVLRELNEEVYDFLFSNTELFLQSQNIFVAEVSKVLKKQKDLCIKAGVELIEIKPLKEREAPSFVLADAFLRKDKKAAFVALHDELATKPAEEVHGGLWYQMKNMALIFSGANESQSGLHPFVYKKLKAASVKFSKKESDETLKELLWMNHRAHRGEVDFEVALEQFILRFT